MGLGRNFKGAERACAAMISGGVLRLRSVNDFV